MSKFEDFMKQVPENLKNIVRDSIRKSPFRYQTQDESDSFPLNFSAHLADKIIQNEDEEYLPLLVDKFLQN